MRRLAAGTSVAYAIWHVGKRGKGDTRLGGRASVAALSDSREL